MPPPNDSLAGSASEKENDRGRFCSPAGGSAACGGQLRTHRKGPDASTAPRQPARRVGRRGARPGPGPGTQRTRGTRVRDALPELMQGALRSAAGGGDS